MPPRKRKIKVVASSPEKARLNFEVIQAILDGQKDEKNHPNLVKQLKNLYQKIPHDSFMRSFIQSLKGAMRHEEANNYANNRLKLCANFIADPAYCEQEETHPLIVTIFDFLLSTISPNAIVRFRICQFVNLVLNAMGPEASLDDDICDKILKYSLERMRDVAPTVRVQAVLALQRLQNPEDPEDDVFRIYTFHLESDPSPKVRQTVITSLGRNYRTIPYIIDRLWDVEERVRRHTYIQMSSYPVKQYKVAQRLTFLEQGLNDHSEMVRRVVKNVLIPQWFESYQKNYVAFVKALKIDADEKELERFGKTAKLALVEIFTKYGIDDATTMLGLCAEDKTVPLENLTIETAICWQALLEFLQRSESDELETFMVDLSAFCNYIKTFADTPTLCNYIRQLADDPSMTTDKLQKMYFQSMMQVLLEIVASYDLGDEVGRENLKKVLAEVLCCSELGEENVRTILTIFERLVGDVEERFRFFVDLINGILEPSRADVSNSSRSLVDEYLEKNPDKSLQMKISSLRLNIMDLKEQEMEKVNRKDYVGAQRVSDELNAANEEYAALLKPILLEVSSSSDGSSIFRESMLKPKKITNATINKCLQILYYLVNSNSVKSLTPIVCELNKSFISRYVESTVVDTRDWALKCSIAFSMLYDGLSKDTFQLLYQQFFRNHCTKIWETSIAGIFELLDRYGFEHFDVESKKDESRKNSRQLFNTRDYLDQDDDANNSNTGSGVDLMKMMTHFFETCEDNVICTAIVEGFCRMIIRGHYTSPDIMTKLLLKYFNPTTEPKMQQILSIFHETLIKKKRQEILQKALLSTLFIILEAPNENPLHEVKPEHVLRFVINSTKPVFCSAGLNPHNTIAMSFLEVMKDNLTYKDLLKLLSKELLTLEISDDQVLKNDLIAITDKIKEEPTLDPKINKNLDDFKQILEGTYREPLAFSSTRAPPIASEEQEAEQQNSDAEEAPEVTEEEPSTPRESLVPLINKSSLDKDNEPLPKSPAKTGPASAVPLSPVTPTTFGSRNTSGMKSLRKSMNFLPPTEKSTPKDVFKVPDATATKKLRQQQSKKAAEKTPAPVPETPEPESGPEPEPTPTSEDSPLEVSSFAIPSTQDTDLGVTDSSLDGDQSILHIPETQRAPEEAEQPEPAPEPESPTTPPPPVQRTPTKRKTPAAKSSSSEEAVSASSDESPATKSSRKRLDGSLEEEVGPSPNATISRFDRSVVRPLVKASAKALVEASKGATPKTLPRTRGVARTETINSKVQTRKSLTEIANKKGSSSRTSLTGIEPLARSPARKDKKEVSKPAAKKVPEVATTKPAQKKTPDVPKKPEEKKSTAEVSKPARATRTTTVEPPKSATTATERRKIYAASLKSKTTTTKPSVDKKEPSKNKKDDTPPVVKRTGTRRTLEKTESPSTRSSARSTATSEKLSPPAKKPSPSGSVGEREPAAAPSGVTMRKSRGRPKGGSSADSPAASTSATSVSSTGSGSGSRGNRTPSTRRSMRTSKGTSS